MKLKIQDDLKMKKRSTEALFESLSSYESIKQLIEEGESESQYLECKTISGATLDRGSKMQLSQLISGFHNSGGGVIIYGVSTTKQAHSGLDILTQIEEIGAVKKLEQQINSTIPRLASPQIDSYETKVIKKKSSDTKGIITVYIPKTTSDPIQATDGKFYIRIKDELNEMPFETLKRMFTGSTSPELEALFDARLVKLKEDESWEIPIIISNTSSVAAKDAEISVTVKNPSSCEKISGETGHFTDQSDINPGNRVFMTELNRPVHRGKNILAGNLIVKMKKEKKHAKRKLDLEIVLYATNMRAKSYSITVWLAKSGFSIQSQESEYLY